MIDASVVHLRNYHFLRGSPKRRDCHGEEFARPPRNRYRKNPVRHGTSVCQISKRRLKSLEIKRPTVFPTGADRGAARVETSRTPPPTSRRREVARRWNYTEKEPRKLFARCWECFKATRWRCIGRDKYNLGEGSLGAPCPWSRLRRRFFEDREGGDKILEGGGAVGRGEIRAAWI